MKKRMIGVAAMLGLIALSSATLSAYAACPPLGSPSSVMIEFDANTFAYETAYTPATFNSAAGSQLVIVSIIDKFYTPFAFLYPALPDREYTFVIRNLVSAGTIPTVAGPTTFYETDYTGGTFEIWEGKPEDAPLAASMSLPANAPGGPNVPSTFENGTKILTGVLCGFHTSISKTGSLQPNGSFRANYHFTGGLYYDRVGNAEALLSGNWCVRTSPAGCRPTGYSAHPNGKFDSPPSTPAIKSTWGQIKTLYR